MTFSVKRLTWRSLKRVVSIKKRGKSNITQPDEHDEDIREVPPEALIFPTGNYDHNVEHSHLYRIPVELVLSIAAYLPPTAIIALRLAGRKLCSIFENPDPTTVSYQDKRAFGLMMKEDSFQWYCRRELIYGISSTDKSPCAKCRTLRPKSDFVDSQLEEAPCDRLCRGHQGALKLCDHTSLDYDEIIALKERKLSADWWSTVRICKHPIHGVTPEELLFQAPMLAINISSAIVISQTHILMQLARNTSPSKEMFQEALKSSSISLCPHVALNNVESFLPGPTCWPEIVKNHDFPFYPSPLDPAITGCNDGACRRCQSVRQQCEKCLTRGCRTSWTIYRRHDDLAPELDKDGILLSWRCEILPQLWYEESPNSKTWLAHMSLEHCRSSEFRIDGAKFLRSCPPEIGVEVMRLRAYDTVSESHIMALMGRSELEKKPVKDPPQIEHESWI